MSRTTLKRHLIGTIAEGRFMLRGAGVSSLTIEAPLGFLRNLVLCRSPVFVGDLANFPTESTEGRR